MSKRAQRLINIIFLYPFHFHYIIIFNIYIGNFKIYYSWFNTITATYTLIEPRFGRRLIFLRYYSWYRRRFIFESIRCVFMYSRRKWLYWYNNMRFCYIYSSMGISILFTKVIVAFFTIPYSWSFYINYEVGFTATKTPMFLSNIGIFFN